MRRARLGRTGLDVSKLCFGTMSFGGDADEAESGRMYAACRDAGIDFFDCANVYSGGAAEEILGRLIAGHRDEIVLTSKVGAAMGPGPNDRGAGARHIRMSVEASLRRLGVDRLDVLFMHRWDAGTPLEETLRALEDLRAAGKTAHLGASNYAAWQVAKGLGTAAARGWAGFDVLQPMLNLVKRQAEVEILPLADAEDLGVITYSPMGGGLLSGKFGPETKPEGSRIATNREYAARYGEPWVFDTAAAFTARARELGAHPASLAVAWVAAEPRVTAPIIGARSLEQLRPSLAALEVPMPPELRADLSALGRPPPVATDRREEQV